jgi:acyl carrier protein
MKHKDLIAKSFNEPVSKIKDNLIVHNYNWDSMTKINLISSVDEKYKKSIDHKKFKKIKTFKDLDNLISKTIRG